MATTLQEQINSSLNHAIFNGYELDEWSVEDIAVDIAQYDAAFESFDPKELMPLIEVWKQSRL